MGIPIYVGMNIIIIILRCHRRLGATRFLTALRRSAARVKAPPRADDEDISPRRRRRSVSRAQTGRTL